MEVKGSCVRQTDGKVGLFLCYMWYFVGHLKLYIGEHSGYNVNCFIICHSGAVCFILREGGGSMLENDCVVRPCM